jgi:hypothetical protein
MTYTIQSAAYANAEHTAAVIQTAESGAVLVSQVDTPAKWAAMLAWGTPTDYVAPPPPVPQSVGRVQAKIWLHRAGKLAAVQSYIDASNDAELQLWWNEANEFRRDNAHVNALAAGFDIDLDVAFTEAAGITA